MGGKIFQQFRVGRIEHLFCSNLNKLLDQSCNDVGDIKFGPAQISYFKP